MHPQMDQEPGTAPVPGRTISRRTLLIGAVTVVLLLVILMLAASRRSKYLPEEDAPAIPAPTARREALSGFDPARFLQSGVKPSALCEKILKSRAHEVSRADVQSLSEEDRTCLMREYLQTSDAGRCRELVLILGYTLSLEAARLFRYSLEQEYLVRTKPLAYAEERFPEALVSGLHLVAIREAAVLDYLKDLANPWNVKALMSSDYPQPNPPIDLEALISHRAIVGIGATGREDAYAMLLELRQGAMVDPTNPRGKGRSFARAFLTAAHAWDGVQLRNETNPGWLSEGMVDTVEEIDYELVRKARMKWEQSPRGREWMDWYNALPADQK